MMRVYKFGLRSPCENEDLVREQLRAANDYKNDLIAIERGRRWALREIDHASEQVIEAEAIVKAATRSTRKAAVSALRQARKAARAAAVDELAAINGREHELLLSARANTTCFWGSYLDIEAAHRQSRAQPLYGDDALTPNDPAFAPGPRWSEQFEEIDPRRIWWLAEGQLGIQLQATKPLDVAGLLGSEDTRARIVLSDRPGSRGRYGQLWLRVGSAGRAPIWAKWGIKMHCHMPDAASVKWVRVSVRPEGMSERWTCEITVDDSAPRARDLDTSLDGAIAVEWEWSPLDDGGMRVARWADTRGGSGEITLPATLVTSIARPAGLRAVRDLLLNDFAPALARVIQESKDAPSWLRAEANTMHLWRSPKRMFSLWLKWQREGGGPTEGRAMIEAFARRERHLYDYEACSRAEVLRRRREVYRVLAAQWARSYRHVLLSDQDLRRDGATTAIGASPPASASFAPRCATRLVTTRSTRAGAMVMTTRTTSASGASGPATLGSLEALAEMGGSRSERRRRRTRGRHDERRRMARTRIARPLAKRLLRLRND